MSQIGIERPSRAGRDFSRLEILVVEDDLEDFERVEEALEPACGMPCSISNARTFKEARAALTSSGYDVILLDLFLPDVRGLETVHQVRRLAGGTPILVMTRLDDEDLALRAVRIGAQDYLVKGSTDLRTLGRTVRHAVERQRKLLELEKARRRESAVANRDPLTSLPNRHLLLDRLERAISMAERKGGMLALVFLDLDEFKPVNDRLGHAVGDQLLCMIAERLASSVRNSDTVCRFGGDEFVILLTNVQGRESVRPVAEKLAARVAEPCRIGDEEIRVGASMGIALYPEDGTEAESLIEIADSAMYQAKQSEATSYVFFAPSMNSASEQREKFDDQLRRAADRRELRMHYQPQIDVATGEVFGAEALLRWSHPDLGLVYPLDFIPIAEQTGAIHALGDWALEQAAAQCKKWREAAGRAIRVAVNVSHSQLCEPGFIRRVGRILDETGLEPASLELEITESSFVRQSATVREALIELKRLGVRLSIDDFGTGYATLWSVKHIPTDVVKIDQAFVHSAHENVRDCAIVDVIVSLAERLGIDVIAEGVETARQEEFLRSRRCPRMQGHHFSPPLPPNEFLGFLATGEGR